MQSWTLYRNGYPGAAIEVHRVLGPGLLESAYTACPVHELRKLGFNVRTEVPVPLVYDGVKLTDVGYRMDISSSKASW